MSLPPFLKLIAQTPLGQRWFHLQNSSSAGLIVMQVSLRTEVDK